MGNISIKFMDDSEKTKIKNNKLTFDEYLELKFKLKIIELIIN